MFCHCGVVSEVRGGSPHGSGGGSPHLLEFIAAGRIAAPPGIEASSQLEGGSSKRHARRLVRWKIEVCVCVCARVSVSVSATRIHVCDPHIPVYVLHLPMLDLAKHSSVHSGGLLFWGSTLWGSTLSINLFWIWQSTDLSTVSVSVSLLAQDPRPFAPPATSQHLLALRVSVFHDRLASPL